MRIGLAAMGDGPIRPAAEAMESLASAAPRLVGHLWIAEAYLFRDALVQGGAALASTSRARVATGVVNVYARHPAVLAMASATLVEEFGDRFVLGLGSGSAPWMQALGYTTDRSYSDVAETVRFLRRLFDGETAELDLSWIRSGPLRLPTQLARTPRLVLAAGGLRMMRLAAESADGVLLPFLGDDLEQLMGTVAKLRGISSTGEPAVGCVGQCFVAGEWMSEQGRREIASLAAALAADPGLGQKPSVFELASENEAPALLARIEQAGLDELAFAVTRSSLHDIARFLTNALAERDE